MTVTLDTAKIPKHIAIIMDGNGRWAKKQGAMRLFGHQSAIEAVRSAVEGCAELGVKVLTLYAFSTENWHRPQEEVNGLMQLLVSTISAETPTLLKNNIKLATIGDIQNLPTDCRHQLSQAIAQTSQNDGMTLVLALSYSGKWEITQVVKQIAMQVKEGGLQLEDITEDTIAHHLQTAQYPDPELMIRTSGEMRISNFLLWQLAYTELYFTEVLWPDFRKEHLHHAIADYQHRERRFGKTGEQLTES